MELHFSEYNPRLGREISYDYEVDDERVMKLITKLFANEYGVSKDAAERIIWNLDLEEQLEEYYKSEIEDHFNGEAYETYKDARSYESDPLGYYGMSERDFI